MYLSDSRIKSICENCLHIFGCSLKNGGEQNINSCEEHETDSFQPIHQVTGESPTQLTFKGLCSNCDYQDTCTLSNKGSIIFSCEEYK